MKNRKREICTSGTVRDEDGNILIYSANDRGDRGDVGIIRSPVRASILPDLVPERDAGRVGGDEAAVGDRDPVRVARQIGQHLLGPGERPLAIDEPLGPMQRREIGLEWDGGAGAIVLQPITLCCRRDSPRPQCGNTSVVGPE